MFRIEPAGERDLEEIRELFREYARSTNAEECFTGFERELAALPGMYAPPGGALLIARAPDNRAAGCVALRPLDPGISEMKRLYVRLEFRGTGLGRAIVSAITDKARARGNSTLRLDTLPHMSEAIAMYRRMGFHEIPRYNDTPGDRVLFFELDLTVTSDYAIPEMKV